MPEDAEYEFQQGMMLWWLDGMIRNQMSLAEIYGGKHGQVLMDLCALQLEVVEMARALPVLLTSPVSFESSLGNPPSKDETTQLWAKMRMTPDETYLDTNEIKFQMSQNIAWLTQEEYYKRFGKSAPAIKAVRLILENYKDRRGFQPEWLA